MAQTSVCWSSCGIRYGIIRAGSETSRSIGALADVKTKRGKLPEPDLVKLVNLICSEDQADEIFDFIFWFAQIDKPASGCDVAAGGNRLHTVRTADGYPG